jgi:hypothetical protein
MEGLDNPKVFNIDVVCDENKQKEVFFYTWGDELILFVQILLKKAKECGMKLFKAHKSEYMQIFNKKIHNLCKQCNDFHVSVKLLDFQF